MSEARFDLSSWPNPTRSSNYQVIYTNISQTTITPWDISLRIGFLNPPPADGQPSVQELATIVFSPPQFKALAAAFANAINAYEARFGTVNVNPDLIQPVGAISQLIEEADRRAAASVNQPPSSR